MNPELRSKLDRITNVLFAGGVNNPVTYIEQLSFLIFLKLLDEEESRRELHVRLAGGNTHALFPGQSSRYRWSEWRFKSGNALRDFIRDEVFPYMASLVREEPQVVEPPVRQRLCPHRRTQLLATKQGESPRPPHAKFPLRPAPTWWFQCCH